MLSFNRLGTGDAVAKKEGPGPMGRIPKSGKNDKILTFGNPHFWPSQGMVCFFFGFRRVDFLGSQGPCEIEVD